MPVTRISCVFAWTQPRPPVNMISEWVYPCPITCNLLRAELNWPMNESFQEVSQISPFMKKTEKDTTLSLSCHISLQSGCYLYKADRHWIRQHNVSPIMAQFAQNLSHLIQCSILENHIILHLRCLDKQIRISVTEFYNMLCDTWDTMALWAFLHPSECHRGRKRLQAKCRMRWLL